MASCTAFVGAFRWARGTNGALASAFIDMPGSPGFTQSVRVASHFFLCVAVPSVLLSFAACGGLEVAA